MKVSKYLLFAAALLVACDKKNDDLIKPILDADFPQIILLSDEGDGELEDEDKFSFKITLADRADQTGNELGGIVEPLKEDVTINFEIEGSAMVPGYLKEAKAFYEIDECTTSEDQDIDLNLAFDASTGKGSVTFPKGVPEIEIEFETDDAAFDDDIFNEEARGLEIELTAVEAGAQHVVLNTANVFAYEVLDDEAVYGEYEVDPEDELAFASFVQLFGLANDDIRNLKAADVEEISIAFEYGEFKATVVLKETEEVEECGETELVNKEIEVEAEFEQLDADQLSGEVEMIGAIEQANGSEKELVYKGDFGLDNGTLTLKLVGEFDGEETEEITLIANK